MAQYITSIMHMVCALLCFPSIFSLRRQDISSHDIEYIEYVGHSLTWGRILSTGVISMWRNDIKCKYIFLFTLKNLARKGFIRSNKIRTGPIHCIPQKFMSVIIYLSHYLSYSSLSMMSARCFCWYQKPLTIYLTHWAQVTHTCVS